MMSEINPDGSNGTRITADNLVPGCHYKIIVPPASLPQKVREAGQGMVIFGVYDRVLATRGGLRYVFRIFKTEFRYDEMALDAAALHELYWVGE